MDYLMGVVNRVSLQSVWIKAGIKDCGHFCNILYSLSSNSILSLEEYLAENTSSINLITGVYDVNMRSCL